MTLNFFMTQGIFRFRQYDRLDDFIPSNLRGDKCPAFWQFLVDEFHFSAVFERLDPFVVGHARSSWGEVRG